MSEINCVLTIEGFIVSHKPINTTENNDEYGDFLDYKILNEIKKKLTITNVNVIGKKRYTIQRYLFKTIKTSNGKFLFIVSRFSGIKQILQSLPNIKVNYINRLNTGIDISDKCVEDLVDLESHQQLCLDFLLTEVYNSTNVTIGIASCIFVMDTGLGKTFIAAALIEKLKVKTLIIIPSHSNLEGWYHPFKLYLKNLTLGEYHHNKKEDGDVVIMIIDSALNDNFNINNKTISYLDYFKNFGLVIYDEIHNYPTELYQNIFWRTNFRYGLGLTATPNERLDKMDIYYYKHVGKVINAKKIPGFLNFANELSWKGKVQAIKYYGPKEYTIRYTNKIGWTDVINMQKQFTNDPYRFQLIIDIILEKLLEERYIFVFAVHRDILESLYDKISQLISFKNIFVKFMGGAKQEEKELALNNACVIFTTYSYGKESVSIKRMDTIIFAQPIKNKMRQTIGRILRRGGNTTIEREIIDIVDMNTSLKNQFDTRKLIYKEKGFPIYKKLKHYNEIKIDNS